MSPRRLSREVPERVRVEMRRVGFSFGQQLQDARGARHWSVRDLADRAGLSVDLIYRVEAGMPCSPEAASRLSVALGLRVRVDLVDPRIHLQRTNLGADLVHSAMGEFEAARLRTFGFGVGMDEPYQHFQFAGRADLIAWNLDERALLHIENRTRFPDFQDMAGTYNSKRAYLAGSLGQRLGVNRWGRDSSTIIRMTEERPLPVALATARRIAVDAALLGAPALRATEESVVNVTRHFGGIQIDPTRTVERTQHLVLWSRLRDYDRALLDIVLKKRKAFEYAAFIVTADRLPELLYYGKQWPGVGGTWRERATRFMAENSAVPQVHPGSAARRRPPPVAPDRRVEGQGWLGVERLDPGQQRQSDARVHGRQARGDGRRPNRARSGSGICPNASSPPMRRVRS